MRKDYAIIGSQAMKHHFSDFPRTPNDTDIITTREYYEDYIEDNDDGIVKNYKNTCTHVVLSLKGVECHYEYLFADEVVSLKMVLNQYCDQDSDYVPVNMLYSLKKGHINFPLKFQKHIGDLMFLREKLRQAKGITLEQDLSSSIDLLDDHPMLTAVHFLETEKRLGPLRTPNMKGENAGKFFGKSDKYVKYIYPHDDIHKAIAIMHSGSPIYEKILKDCAEVETSEAKWNTLSVQEKIWCVMEEVYVIALERKIIPSFFDKESKHVEDKEAFDWALMRVCTTLCDGFFREFSVRAYDIIQFQYNPDYVKQFFKNISI